MKKTKCEVCGKICANDDLRKPFFSIMIHEKYCDNFMVLRHVCAQCRKEFSL